MPKKKPRKPTTSYGYVNFPKQGPVEKRMFQLSNDKKTQERQVIEDYVNRLSNIRDDVSVIEIVDLPEADHDFLLRTETGQITVELTEIPERDYTIKITEEEYSSCRYHTFIQNQYGALPVAVDESRRDSSIQRSIAHKVGHYAKSDTETLWLLVWTTSTYLQMTYWEGGAKQESAALQNAQQFLTTVSENPFDEIWCTNLLMNPTQIWASSHNN